MLARAIAELSAKILLDYYDNNIQPFLDACHEDIMWIGPAQGQVMRTKATMLAAFASEHNELRFAVHNLSVTPIATSSPTVYEVAMRFLVDTFWPDGGTNRVDQCICLSWVDCESAPRIILCHISNAIAYDGRDHIYPLNYEAKYGQDIMLSADPRSGRICVQGLCRATLYLEWDSVTHAESHGTHTIIHTTTDDYESVETLSAIAHRYGKLFVRCHASYLVNPAFVHSVTRFKVTLEDGKELPIPEKKYARVRELLAERLG